MGDYIGNRFCKCYTTQNPGLIDGRGHPAIRKASSNLLCLQQVAITEKSPELIRKNAGQEDGQRQDKEKCTANLLFATKQKKELTMPDLTIKQVDAFTTEPFSGNPAGVIADADGLTSQDMLMIAGEMNLAETAFITMPSSPDAMFRIKYFTPMKEVDLSGHATIASCYALIEDKRIPVKNGITTIDFETNTGKIEINIHFSLDEKPETDGNFLMIDSVDGKGILRKIMMRQIISDYRPSTVPLELLTEILGIDRGEILGTGLDIEVISTGFDQLMIPVQRKETILNLNPDLIKLGLMNKKYDIDTNHIYSLDTFSEDCITYSRHFAPAVGMWEDPATGTAAAGLGTYLLRNGIATSGSMVMEQGKELDSLAKILVEVSNLDGSVQIGGLAITSITRTLHVEDNAIVVT